MNMKRYIRITFICALGWIGCASSIQCTGNQWKDGNQCKDIPTHDDNSPGVSTVPFIGKCAVDGHDLKVKSYLHICDDVDCDTMEECGKVCDQWADCISYVLDYTNPNKKKCLIIGRQGFQNDYFGEGAIQGFKDCPRSERCIHNDLAYLGAGRRIVKVKNVLNPYDCQARCRNHPNCYFFSLCLDPKIARLRLMCVLHDGKNVGEIRAENGFISGSTTCLSCYLFNSVLNLLPNIETDGKSYQQADDYKECQNLCYGDVRCSFFQFISSRKRCFKKNEKTALTPKENRAFAVRGCDLACNCSGNGLKDERVTDCDTVGNCKCKDNYKDKYCRKCEDGFTKQDDGACACSCSGNGLKDQSDTSCDATGQCNCKDHYKDKGCTECEEGFTKQNDGSCTQQQEDA